MQLPSYQSFAEKREFFEIHKIEDVEELEKCIYNYQSDSNFLFRGVKDASYKMLSSLHRKMIEYDKHPYLGIEAVLLPLCEEIWKISKVRDMFYKSQENEGEVSGGELYEKAQRQTDGALKIKVGFFLMSLLQHYTSFSLLLDVTRNIRKALYFGIINPTPPTDNEISNYFSILVIPKKYITNTHDLKDEDDVGMMTIDAFKKSIENSEIKSNEILDYFKRKLLLFEHLESIKWSPHILNERIEAQEGEFLYYLPIGNEGAETKYKMSPTTEENQLRDKDPIKSLEINKSLIPVIRKLHLKDYRKGLSPKSSNIERIIKCRYKKAARANACSPFF